jgi:hypothetical protein
MTRPLAFFVILPVLFVLSGPALSASAQQSINQITAIAPTSAVQGTSGLTVTFTLDTDEPHAPPINVVPDSVKIGGLSGASVAHPVTNVVTAVFNTGDEAPGPKDSSVIFTTPMGTLVFTNVGGFTVLEMPPTPPSIASQPQSRTAKAGAATTFTVGASGSVPLSYQWQKNATNIVDAVSNSHAIAAVAVADAGGYRCIVTNAYGAATSDVAVLTVDTNTAAAGLYPVVDTGQTSCYNNTTSILPPAAGQPFYGQDAQNAGHAPSYALSGDGLTVHDNVTGLTWQRSPDTTGDGNLNASDKLSYSNALLRPTALNASHYGGFSDWRLPSIKEQYSLIDFRGTDPSGLAGNDTSGLTPYIDTNYFQFAYGNTNEGDRIIDSQYASSNLYVSAVDGTLLFGVNFADGRIKGYGLTLNGSEKTFFVQCVRGNPDYGVNLFTDNGDGTISDRATGLMWTKADSGAGLNWSNALAWVQARNAENHLGHSDWRLPDAKELQSIVDYSRSPDTTGFAAIETVFTCTPITNEEYQLDWPWYWSGTTHAQYNGSGAAGAYVAFGRGLGYMNNAWVDIHGAGCQRSDPKANLNGYTQKDNGYYNFIAPQGDAVRCYNYVRLVRDAPTTTAWRFAFVGDTHTPLSAIPSEIADAVVADGIKLLIVAGDLVEIGTGGSTNMLANRLAMWSNAFASVTAAGIPVYVVRGNHENDVTNNLEVWINFFAMPGNGPAGESNLTYSLVCSNAMFLGFDQYINLHQNNQAWLDQQLAANTRPHVFAFGHEPAFKTFHTDCLDNQPDARNAFWIRLAAAGARVYLCGHDHLFNVVRIDDGDGNSSNDLFQFVVGTGGSTNWPPASYAYNGTNSTYTPVNVTNLTATYGYLLVEISGPDTNDLGVTLTWKQRVYDTNTATAGYVAADVLAYTAVNRYVDSVGDGIPDWWRVLHFGGDGRSTNSDSCATCDPDQDHFPNVSEAGAGTLPGDPDSFLGIVEPVWTVGASNPVVVWQSVLGKNYRLERSADLATDVFTTVVATDLAGDPPENVYTDTTAAAAAAWYRIQVE